MREELQKICEERGFSAEEFGRGNRAAFFVFGAVKPAGAANALFGFERVSGISAGF